MNKILEKIHFNANNYPDRIAYSARISDGVSDSILKLTWHELESKSNFIANFLNNSFPNKKPVIVYGHKDPKMIIIFLACAKSGRAYVPVDSSFPLGRINDIIDAVRPELIFSTVQFPIFDRTYKVFESQDVDKLFVGNSDIDPSKFVDGNDVFYIIFTSGSTGLPKGVQITADCLSKFVEWAMTLDNNYLADNNAHIFINQAPFSFDLSVFDLYLSLFSCGTEYAIPKNMLNDMNKMYEYLAESDADVWVSTPSFAEMSLADDKFNEHLMPNLRLFLFCGETLTNQTVQKLFQAFPKAHIINTYGPTESTVAMTSVLITKELCENYNPLPIGIPKKGTYVFIMDEDGNVLPDGEKGEIVIVGDTVSIGYWNNEKKNEEVFGKKVINGIQYRLYHTHDKGFYDNGMLFYCGRIDLQIKLHGYRIEIEDIENNILTIDNIERVVVLPEYVDGEVKTLAAYIVLSEKTRSNLQERKRIREELKKKIPEYMIPKKFIFKDNLPVTSNGKVDRKQLENMSNAKD